MSGEADLETRRKRLLYRSIYRGNKENDILLGQFARAHIAAFGAAELDQYERLLATGDNDIFDWVSGQGRRPARGRYAGAAQAAGVSREVLVACRLPIRLAAIHRKAGRWTIAGLPEGADALVLADLARTTGGQDILHVARDGQRLERLQDGLRFFAPEREVLVFPAWDCLPYDRVSPHPDIVAERLDDAGPAGRAQEARRAGADRPGLGRRRAAEGAAAQPLRRGRPSILRKGQTVDVAWLTKFLGENGYGRAETVMEPGEFAVRGGLIDLFPPGTAEPLRLDLFGDALEAIRSFDPMSQRSTGTRDEVVLLPVSEVLLTADGIARFRSGYRELFGNVGGDDLALRGGVGRPAPCRHGALAAAVPRASWRRCSTTAPTRS